MHWRFSYQLACFALLHAALSGCGITKSRTATDQLLASSAVDSAISQIDFSLLAGETVYLDTQFVGAVKSAGFVNANYIISSLRQQITAANCLLQDNKEDADFVVEPRVGTLGSDGHEINYGMPANNALGIAGSFITRAETRAEVPEVSLAKKHDYRGVAKLSVFAYHRESREPVWQSGIAMGESTSKSLWVFGAGPFQQGTIHQGTQFAGETLDELSPIVAALDGSEDIPPQAMYFSERNFQRFQTEADQDQLAGASLDSTETTKSADQADEDPTVETASHEEIVEPAVQIPDSTDN